MQKQRQLPSVPRVHRSVCIARIFSTSFKRKDGTYCPHELCQQGSKLTCTCPKFQGPFCKHMRAYRDGVLFDSVRRKLAPYRILGQVYRGLGK